jgi:hypothetical protein
MIPSGTAWSTEPAHTEMKQEVAGPDREGNRGETGAFRPMCLIATYVQWSSRWRPQLDIPCFARGTNPAPLLVPMGSNPCLHLEICSRGRFRHLRLWPNVAADLRFDAPPRPVVLDVLIARGTDAGRIRSGVRAGQQLDPAWTCSETPAELRPPLTSRRSCLTDDQAFNTGRELDAHGRSSRSSPTWSHRSVR